MAGQASYQVTHPHSQLLRLWYITVGIHWHLHGKKLGNESWSPGKEAYFQAMFMGFPRVERIVSLLYLLKFLLGVVSTLSLTWIPPLSFLHSVQRLIFHFDFRNNTPPWFRKFLGVGDAVSNILPQIHSSRFGNRETPLFLIIFWDLKGFWGICAFLLRSL